ncbi:MAG: mannose-1-phosphate guanylyltransferase/mannose-6-phosphate isomerase [Alphaproteobacteria bacterium]
MEAVTTDMGAREDAVNVLLIDDDSLYRESIVPNLEDHQLAVEHFADGNEALKWLVDGHTCDVVLLDWHMPTISGAEVLKKLRLLGFNLPVVILTAFASEKNEVIALDGGAVDFMDKSRSSSVIARRLRVVAEGAKGTGPKLAKDEALELGSLHLNLKVDRAQWKGQSVPLTVVEFNIVRLLASRAGEDVTYREIYDVVRGKEFFAGDGILGHRTNVRSLIKRIRQKFRQLDDSFAAIENYPAFGYRWVPDGAYDPSERPVQDTHETHDAGHEEAPTAQVAQAPSHQARAPEASNLEMRATASAPPAAEKPAPNRVAQAASVKGKIHPVILSGGSGTRLWPLSRQAYPKQLLPLMSERTMLQETASRTASDSGFAAPIVVCSDEHRFLIAEQLQETGIEPRRIVLEPVARNTAPAAAVAALLVIADDPDGVMLVQPSDHHIADMAAFRKAIDSAMTGAKRDLLCTFGIRPTRAETGYGYIAAGEPVEDADGILRVDRFVEKPSQDDAERYLARGSYRWNSGIFLMPAALYLSELRRLQPAMVKACERAVAEGKDDLDFFRLDAGIFGQAPNLSIDHAVMEHTTRAAIVPVDMGWSDIGSWRSLREIKESDEAGNVTEGDVILDRVRNSYIRGDGHLVAAIGVEDLIVVATDDVVLVADSEHSADVGKFVSRLRNRPERLHHTKVYRPWGFYQTVDIGERFQVKRIMVKPGAKLSLQMHHHRAEHWVVVSGTALTTCNDETRLLHENEAIYIPAGATHRLENPGKVPVHLIEVQSGAYLGEDDIVRFEDTYGRH